MRWHASHRQRQFVAPGHPVASLEKGAPMRRIQLLVLPLVAAALLAGCAGASDSVDTASGEVAMYAEEGAESGAAASDADPARIADQAGPPGSDGTTTDVAVAEAYLVREASLGIKVDSITDAAAQVREIAAGAGGSVTNEQFGDGFYGPEGTGINRYGSLTISVPSEALDATLTELTSLGEVRTRTSNAYSVQDEYIDVEARIATLDASITRMRALMDQTEDIKQIIELETALSARQADLDSLQARLNGLTSQIAMSPITVMLTTTDDLGQPEGGIVGALRDAWNAFTASAAVLITSVGAILPWLLVAGVVAAGALKGAKAVRRRRSRSAASQTAGTAPTADGGPAVPSDS